MLHLFGSRFTSTVRGKLTSFGYIANKCFNFVSTNRFSELILFISILFIRRLGLLQPVPVMATRLTLHSQLTSIVETMAKSLLGQICKLVDDEASDLRLQLARLLVANSNLADKVNNLERKLSTARRETPASYTSQRTVGVQTDCNRNGDASGMSFNICTVPCKSFRQA